MNIPHRCISSALPLFAVALLALPIALFAQGSLAPPAGPGPTMKSLDQLEPRTMVNAANTPGDVNNTFIISAPGSYYLTGNITGTEGKHGISIQADDVTLDLNGFALISGGGATRGVDVPPGQKNFAIRNGTVRDWVDGGVRADLAIGTLVEKLRLSNNAGPAGLVLGRGSARDCVAVENDTGFRVLNGGQISDSAANANNTGFVADDRAHISNCISTENSDVGFRGSNFVTLIDCTASRNFGAAGIAVLGSSIIIRCNATRNIPSGNGITAGPGCTIADCVTGNNGMHGISAGAGSTVQNCTANANPLTGFTIGQNCTITSSTATGNGAQSNQAGISADYGSTVSACTANQNYIGFYVLGSIVSNCMARGNHFGFLVEGEGSRIESNSAFNNGVYGFDFSAGNLVVRNTARGNDQGNYVGSNSLGGVGRILNTSGEITVSEPWVNFSY